jgi:ATP-dependent RNA helicase RhlE
VIAQLPSQRQTLFFSATMPPEAEKLADAILRDPQTAQAAPVSSTVDTVNQLVHFVGRTDKRAHLVRVLGDREITRALVFTRTKHAANRVAEHLQRAGVTADAIHGNKSQNARERALERFKRGQSRVLVATDIAARGIDIEQVSHVINFDLPNVPETYVHRIGRTARAGASGIAVSFCDAEEVAYLRDIERLIGKSIPTVGEPPASAPGQAAPPPRAPGGSPRPPSHAPGRHRRGRRPRFRPPR